MSKKYISVIRVDENYIAKTANSFLRSKLSDVTHALRDAVIYS